MKNHRPADTAFPRPLHSGDEVHVTRHPGKHRSVSRGLTVLFSTREKSARRDDKTARRRNVRARVIVCFMCVYVSIPRAPALSDGTLTLKPCFSRPPHTNKLECTERVTGGHVYFVKILHSHRAEGREGGGG